MLCPLTRQAAQNKAANLNEVVVYLTVFSILVATGYGIAFSYAYPLTEIDERLVSFVAVLGLATCRLITGIGKWLANVFQIGIPLTNGARNSSFRLKPQGEALAAGIFISYRRADSKHAAGWLVERLQRTFSNDQL